MSERKTAEIKFRVTPSEKAAWQARADREEIGLSELIRNAMLLEQERRAERNTLTAIESTRRAIEMTECRGCDICEGLSDAESPTDPDPVAPTGDVASPQEDVPTSDEVGALSKPAYPWQFNG